MSTCGSFSSRRVAAAALAEPTAAALGDLATLLDQGEFAAVVSTASSLPEVKGLDHRAVVTLFQMACDQRPQAAARHFHILEASDSEEMIELARATEPGPFEKNTIAMGTYLGAREDGRLIAMAGERLQPDGWIEVSGVCTLPEARGKGLATGLVTALAHRAADMSCGSFLHVVEGSPSMETALSVYGQCGFETRTKIYVHVLAARESGSSGEAE